MRRAANPWDRFYRHQPTPWRGEQAVADLAPRLGDGPVLELGCGNGKTLRPLRRAGVEAVGLDVSWNVLKGHGHGVPLVLGDAAALPFADGVFSAVLDLHCTGHLLREGRARAAAEAARILRPGGLVVVERLTPVDLRVGTGSWVEGEDLTRRLSDGRTTHFSDETDLRLEFGGAGLVPESSVLLERAIRHRGEPVLRSAVRAFFRKPA